MSLTWNLDNSHSEVQFKIKHMVISTVTGDFLDFSANAKSEDETFQGGEFQFEAKIDSINTKNPQRDEHLKSADFFNAEEFPTMSYTGKLEGDTIKGELTLRGVTKPVNLHAEFGGVIKDPYGNQRSGFELTGELNRKDFGLSWDALTESGGVVVSDKVKLFVNLEFIQQ
ncbi:YceI family protein [Moheibacter stercoris]|uniref:Polyisoprenoid-binding protein YceI n=1 Tax=Moheibacter stercoris TaxID=1628251 RepID=A0ABV2LYJ7_9FLAO